MPSWLYPMVIVVVIAILVIVILVAVFADMPWRRDAAYRVLRVLLRVQQQ